MAATATADTHGHETKLPDGLVDLGPMRKCCLAAAAIGLGAWLICGFVDMGHEGNKHATREFFISYLCGFVYWACIPFGALMLSFIGLLTSASWSVIFRRIFAAALRTLPVLALLGLPILISLYILNGEQSPYWWAEKSLEGEVSMVAEAKKLRFEAVEEMQHKMHDYLNPGFFTARYVFYFALLYGMAFFLLKWQRPLEDTNDAKAKASLYGYAGPALIATVLTLTFFVTDWIMSVEPTWASSMFPMIFGMNCFLMTVTFSTLVFYSLTQGKSDITAVMKDKFRIDIGTLTLGFCMIWAYASFCQFMLIWAGNLPEELTYYLKRGAGERKDGTVNAWIYLAYILMAFHWLLPFIILLFREIKLNPKHMQKLAILLLTVCAADIVFWIVPSVPHEHSTLHVPMALGAILGLGGVWGLFFTRELGKRGILAQNNEVKFLAEWGHH